MPVLLVEVLGFAVDRTTTRRRETRHATNQLNHQGKIESRMGPRVSMDHFPRTLGRGEQNDLANRCSRGFILQPFSLPNGSNL